MLKDKKEDSSEHFLEFLQMQLEAEIRNRQQRAVFMGNSASGKRGGALVALGYRDSPDEATEGEGHCFANDRTKTTVCEFCNLKPHPLFRCYKFASSPYEDKVKYVQEKNLCFKCLKPGHTVKECTTFISCEFCDSPYDTRHNLLLHKDEQPLAMNTYGAILKAERQKLGSRPFSSACVVLHLRCPETGKVHAINGLADTGASDFLMDTSVTDRRKLKGKGCQFTVLGHGGHESMHEWIAGDIVAINPETKEEYDMSYDAYEGPCEGMFPEDWSQLKGNWPHLKHLEIPPPIKGKHVEAIVGCKYLALFEASSGEDIHKGKDPGDPVAKKTPLGWVVAGKTSTAIHGQALSISGQLNGFAIVAGLLGDERPPDYGHLYLQPSKALRVENAVLLQDDDCSIDPRRWRAGKIMTIHKSKDNRSYDILVDGENHSWNSECVICHDNRWHVQGYPCTPTFDKNNRLARAAAGQLYAMIVLMCRYIVARNSNYVMLSVDELVRFNYAVLHGRLFIGRDEKLPKEYVVPFRSWEPEPELDEMEMAITEEERLGLLDDPPG